MDTAQGRDTLIEHAEEFDFAAEDSAIEAPPAIGGDERRMHVRAYNYWASLLGNRALPSIEDLEPADIEDFGPHGVCKTSAQIRALYPADELVGRQIVGVINFPKKQIGTFVSEFLLTGFHTDEGVVITTIERPVANGARLA